LDALVEEATTDAYRKSEQAVGLLTPVANSLRLVFETELPRVKMPVASRKVTQVGRGTVYRHNS